MISLGRTIIVLQYYISVNLGRLMSDVWIFTYRVLFRPSAPRFVRSSLHGVLVSQSVRAPSPPWMEPFQEAKKDLVIPTNSGKKYQVLLTSSITYLTLSTYWFVPYLVFYLPCLQRLH